jgi:hypothetical protein
MGEEKTAIHAILPRQTHPIFNRKMPEEKTAIHAILPRQTHPIFNRANLPSHLPYILTI